MSANKQEKSLRHIIPTATKKGKEQVVDWKHHALENPSYSFVRFHNRLN